MDEFAMYKLHKLAINATYFYACKSGRKINVTLFAFLCISLHSITTIIRLSLCIFCQQIKREMLTSKWVSIFAWVEWKLAKKFILHANSQMPFAKTMRWIHRFANENNSDCGRKFLSKACRFILSLSYSFNSLYQFTLRLNCWLCLGQGNLFSKVPLNFIICLVIW